MKLNKLELRLLGEDKPAGLIMSSVPCPDGEPTKNWTFGGRPTDVQGLGEWPGEGRRGPRRLLMYADGGEGSLCESLSLEQATPAALGPLPEVSYHCFARCPDPNFMWERAYLKIQHGDKTLGLALGMRRKGKVNWWEACRVIEERVTPFCREVTMGGVIPWDYNDRHDFKGFKNPYLHKHNWLNGHLRLRLFANGVVEVFARHVNARYVDLGGDCDEGVPVVGFFTEEEKGSPVSAPFDGTQSDFQVGGVALDLSEVAPMATPERPGSWERQPGVSIFQPYEGFELFGGGPTLQRYGQPYVCRSEDKKILKGMARSLRFSMSFGVRPARIARYLPPAWWFAHCSEFSIAPNLPVSLPDDPWMDKARAWAERTIQKSGFEVGNLPRSGGAGSVFEGTDRMEPGWEGEVPYGLMLMAYRSGDVADYNRALTACIYFNDVIVEHAEKQVRMHGYPPPALSIPMNRVQACIVAWLETGDAFPLQTAEAVMESSYRFHLNSWPRMAVGRDAMSGRGAFMLYRYCNNRHFLKIAREIAYAVHHVQRPDGTFGDQGGGACVHGWGAFIIKPWMGNMAMSMVMDILEMFPEETPLWETAERFSKWMRSNQVEVEGGVSLCYQHQWNEGNVFHFYLAGGNDDKRPDILPNPAGTWHSDGMGRVLLPVSQRTGDYSFLNTWEKNSDCRKKGGGGLGDHGTSALCQFYPWILSQQVQARVAGNHRLEVSVSLPGEGSCLTGSIDSPWGTLEYSVNAAEGFQWVGNSSDAKVEVSSNVSVLK